MRGPNADKRLDGKARLEEARCCWRSGTHTCAALARATAHARMAGCAIVWARSFVSFVTSIWPISTPALHGAGATIWDLDIMPWHAAPTQLPCGTPAQAPKLGGRRTATCDMRAAIDGVAAHAAPAGPLANTAEMRDIARNAGDAVIACAKPRLTAPPSPTAAPGEALVWGGARLRPRVNTVRGVEHYYDTEAVVAAGGRRKVQSRGGPAGARGRPGPPGAAAPAATEAAAATRTLRTLKQSPWLA